MKIDCILSEPGSEFSDGDPHVEQLIKLSNEADKYYKEQHTEGYTDIEISLEQHYEISNVCNSCKVLVERKIRITFAPRNKKAS